MLITLISLIGFAILVSDIQRKIKEGFLIPYDSNRANHEAKFVAEIEDTYIEFSSEPLEYSNNRRQVGLEIVDIARITCKAPISVDELNQKILEPIRNFISLATARPNSVTALSAIISDTQRVKIYTQSSYQSQPYFSLYNQGIIIFLAEEIVDRSTEYIKKWLELEREIPDVCELFFGVHCDHGAFSSNKFLNLVQALEAYSRFRYGRHETPEEEYKRRVGLVVDAVPDEHKSWLEQKLYFSNHKPLKKRLIELISVASGLIDSLIPDPEEFSRWVADTRNYLTHVDRTDKKRIADGGYLDALTSCLLWLFRIHLLLEIGFSHDQCSTLLSKNRVYQDLCSYVKEETRWGNAPDQET